MRFATRTFLWSFVPFAVLLTASFWAMRTAVLSAVRDGLRASVRENQVSLARERTRSEVQNQRVLGVVAENPALKAGVRLLISDRGYPDDARRTVEDQLSELCDSLGFDLLEVSSPAGEPLAGIMRQPDGFAALDWTGTHPPQRGFFSTEAGVFRVTSVPMNEGQEPLGTLAVGERFRMEDFTAAAVLLNGGKIVAASTKGLELGPVEKALRVCAPAAECEFRIGEQTYLSAPMEDAAADQPDGYGYRLRSLQSIDAASAPVQAALRRVFFVASLSALLAALGISVLSSRSIVRPLAEVVAQLRESGKTGVLPQFPVHTSGIQEIRDLSVGFSQAARAVYQGRENLLRAYVEFAGSLASALDARDPYTAGHSRRVSEASCAIGRAMKLPPEELETIRVGALLHDIGKIGISDTVLQKPGRLTPEELSLIQEHPVIGRRILEGVHGFEPYLGVVELHHENWDGSGYPRGLKGEDTPLPARIVKVADAYDAMTTDRPYRRGMSHQRAIRILEENVGTQLDPTVVRTFVWLHGAANVDGAAAPKLGELHSLANALQEDAAIPAPVEGGQS
jgi:HD-GYP domain-containing protein (c-di-GMP phosphodiesterase class II)